MNCREARLVLAADRRATPPDKWQAALDHLASCAACRARVDQFGAAILSGVEDEIPCAESRVHLDAYVAAELGRQSAARTFPLVHAHLERCPECAEEARILVAGLVGLRDDTLPLPASAPRFDTRFALAEPGARRGADRRPGAGATLLGLLRRWREALAGPGQWAARGALAAAAVVVLALFAGLVAYQPALRLRAQSLAPFNPSLRATAAAYIAATETVAASMGRDWVDELGTPAGSPGSASGVAPARHGRPSATPSLDQPARTATAERAEATRQARERRARTPIRAGILPTATVTPTVAVTLTLAPPPATEAPRREPTAEPPEPPATSPPPEPTKGSEEPYPPPRQEPDDPYP